MSKDDPSLGFYTLIYMAAVLAIAVLLWALDALFGLRAPGTALGAVAPMVAALATGQRWAGAHGSVPNSGVAWRFAIKATLVVAAINLVIGGAILASAPALMPRDIGMTATLALAATFASLVLLALNRFFVTYGASTQLRAAR